MTPQRWPFRFVIWLLPYVLPHAFLVPLAHGQDDARIDFNRQIRPILNEHCTNCHGGVKQAGDVSFIYREQTLESGIIVPGQPEESELIARITTDDPDLRMPPPDHHPAPLSAADIALLRRWIEQDAPWGEHWSLQRPRDALDQARQESDWPRSRLDHFVLRRLRQEQLPPSPEAPPGEWLRRVSYDLTGLPPTMEELAAFERSLATAPDDQDRLYAAAVDRLLGSEHYGERWAALWMDLARYADTMGYEKDPHREMWPYRDWLIRALNDDLPYDQFTRKQLAGDLLQDATTDDLIATAFHRNTQTNTEGGTDDEEFRTAAVIDRINTTWTVWLGTTFGCVQCHSHPYDPFRHEEYYRFMAFFNNTEDHDLDDDFPTVRLADDAEQRSQLSGLLARRTALQTAINGTGRELAERSAWRSLDPTQANSTHGTLAIRDNIVAAAGGTFAPGCRYTIETNAADCTAVRLEILPESDDPTQWPEVGSVVSRFQLERVAADGTVEPLTFSHAYADFVAGPYAPEQSLRDGAEGFGGYPKLHGPRWVVFALASPFAVQAGDQLRFSLLQAAQTTGSRAVHLRRLRLAYDDDPAWIALNTDATLAARRHELAQTEQALDSLSGPRLPVMQERQTSATRPTRLFVRGNWLKRGELQSPDTPHVLPALGHNQPTRLDLADWLTSADNPLAARVLANRLWAALFGGGIVETQENFGTTGTAPSHPELLDHLAIRLQHEHRWRWKPFLRELVLSATYRQSQRMTPELRERDPDNRLLARGPRTRLSAEMVRDQVLVTSGLLIPKIGGPSVMPPQPDGVWHTVYSNAQWKTAEGPDRYRRALYTYWRRTSPYPSFLMFDAPSREFCAARRIPTNTPLQALVTLNDPVYTECAAALADRAWHVAGDDPEAAIDWAFQAVTQQEASPKAFRALATLYHGTLAELQSSNRKENDATSAEDKSSGDDVSLANGQSPAEDQLPDEEQVPATPDPQTIPRQTALTIVMNTLLNLDQALTK